jgi:hypothetical protein
MVAFFLAYTVQQVRSLPYYIAKPSFQYCGSETFCYGSRSDFSKSFRFGSEFEKVTDPVSDPSIIIYFSSRINPRFTVLDAAKVLDPYGSGSTTLYLFENKQK